MGTKKAGVIVGSIRKGSYTKKLVVALQEMAQESLQFEIVDISALEMYNQDIDDAGTPTSAWTDFRNKIKEFDAILFATPEHNRSVPAALKNAIDVGSRPYGQSIWNGKPAAVISVSPGAIGAFGANHHLRQSLVFLNIPVMPFEVYIGNVTTLLDGSGKLINEKTREFLQSFLDSFEIWITKNS